VIAFNNPHIQVTVVDRDVTKVQQWKSKHLPVREPGLDMIVRTARDGARALDGQLVASARHPNLFFTHKVEETIATADVIFICVNTPTKEQGIGAGMAPNLFAFEAAVRTIAQHAKSGAIVVEKSTVPCGTSQRVQDIVRSLDSKLS
jgi:UDPglucose 6-dehydrogenase